MPCGSSLLASASGAGVRQGPSPCWRPWRTVVRRGSGRGFLNKLVALSGFCVHGQGLEISFSARQGDGEDGDFLSFAAGHMDLQQGSLEAAPGSESSAAILPQPLKEVGRRPLPPLLLVSVLFGRRLKAKINNLQAAMPMRRPLCCSSVGSWSLVPSGTVPGGEDLCCAATWRCGGDGAGPDGFSCSSFRVHSANSLDLVVISFFLVVLFVNLPPINESF
jgi:hypothetical protein